MNEYMYVNIYIYVFVYTDIAGAQQGVLGTAEVAPHFYALNGLKCFRLLWVVAYCVKSRLFTNTPLPQHESRTENA